MGKKKKKKKVGELVVFRESSWAWFIFCSPFAKPDAHFLSHSLSTQSSLIAFDVFNHRAHTSLPLRAHDLLLFLWRTPLPCPLRVIPHGSNQAIIFFFFFFHPIRTDAIGHSNRRCVVFITEAYTVTFFDLNFLVFYYYYLLFFFSVRAVCVKKTPGVCSPIRVVSLR